MRQSVLMFMIPIKEGMIAGLRELLDSVGRHIDDNELISFDRYQAIHFLRLAILPAQHNGCASHDRLILSTNYDGSFDAHLDDLLGDPGNFEGLRTILACCEGVDEGATRDAVRDTLKRHRIIKGIAFFVGAIGRDVRTIRREEQLRQEIQRFLDAGDWSTSTSLQVYAQIVEHIKAQDCFDWAGTPYPHKPMKRAELWALVQPLSGVLITVALSVLSLAVGTVVGGVAGLLATLLGLGVLVTAALAYFRYLEKTDSQREPRPADTGHVSELAAIEDYQVQNQMTSLVRIKPGWFRLFLLRAVLGLVNLLGVLVYNKGVLGGIESIHFARWVIVDNNRHLLFLSNFDGSWESYLGDFIDKAAGGLTAVWSNTVEFPRSRWLTKGGARDEFRFKAAVRDSQLPTDVWYSAYPHLTIRNVLSNAEIRRGISANLSEEETERWLARL